MITPHPDDVTLNEYADGTLPASQQRVVDAHVSTCGSCRDVVDSVRQLQTAVRQLPPLSPPRKPSASRRKSGRIDDRYT